MSVKLFASQMKATIQDIKDKGTAAIFCDNLISYLTEVENSPEPELSPVELERIRADLQNWVEGNKYQNESSLEMFRSVISSGQNAIKTSFLLNGGAAIALLAFIGHITEVNAQKVALFGACLLPFAYGVLAIAVTSGLTYLGQWLYASTNSKAVNAGYYVNISCIILGLSSYGFFVWGLLSTYHAITSFA